jgi:UDP-N-acetylmuramate: L-alanyl-gamma-D-glutamyl-meso-diaminopimelate ligase
MINLDSVNKIYFIGIGGIGMSAAAGIAQSRDFEVEGSDSKEVYAPARDVLEYAKIPYHIGYDAKNIEVSKAHLFVISSGEDLNNPEVKYVYEHNLPHVSFAEMLYGLTKDMLRVVVAGTHGKSTTTGLLGHVFKNVDDGSFMTGAVLKNYGSNFYFGDGHYVVFEGDEYKSEFDDPTPKFHYYKPDILVLTNLEYDHPDLFSSVEDLENEFDELIQAMPEDGLIVYNADDVRLTKLVHRSNISTVSFGVDNEADYKIEEIEYGPEYTSLEVMNKFSKNVSSKLLGQTEQYKIQLPGKINVYNSLAVIATMRALGFSQDQIALELLTYQGIKRRFEVIGEKNGVTLIDDYAHHPTAVRQTLEAARLRYPTAKIWAVFEPHTFSRTEATLPDLAKSFDAANEVLISKIYPAREKAKAGTITSEQVVEQVKGEREKGKVSGDVRLVDSKQQALDILKTETKPGDVVIVMAVGDFNRLSYELKEVL